MSIFLAMAGFVGFIVFLVWTIISKIKKDKTNAKQKKIGLVVCVVLFVVGIALSPSDTESGKKSDSYSGSAAKIEQQKSEKKKKANSKVSAEEKQAKVHDVSSKEWNLVSVAADATDIKKDDISNITFSDDKLGCTFDYGDYSFSCNFDKSGAVQQVQSGTIVFLKDGKLVQKVSDRIITSDEKVQLLTWSEDYVKQVLKAPSTAKFPGDGFLNYGEDWTLNKSGTDYSVKSYVDSQNSFGAMIRSNFAIYLTWDGKSDSATVNNFVFDGKTYKVQ